MIKVAINGFGRIGRMVLRAVFEIDYAGIEVVAINGPADISQHIHLLEFDSIHGRFKAKVRAIGEDVIEVNDKKIRLFRERDLSNLDWGALDVDIVMECSGAFTSRDKASLHIKQGAKKVIISAPSSDKDVKTVVWGVNQTVLTGADELISIGSCTTNCLAPVASVLHEKIGIIKGFMTTIHAYTGDQNLLDGSHGKNDLRRARASAVSMVPTSTGAAKAIGLVIPSLKGCLDGSAIRVPVANVSVVDLCFQAHKNTSVEEVNNFLREAANAHLKGVLGYENRPLVSVDFCHNPHSSIVDSLETKVTGENFVRVLAWYDNEWGFSVRMLDVAKFWMDL
jgi:glyceraldehyde 3-phosphate dehydrogenase